MDIRNIARRPVVVASTLLVTGLVALTGCSSTSGASSPTAASDRIVIGLSSADVSFGAYYLAQQLGYYKQEGIDVELQQTGSNTVNSVVSGQADLGSIGAGTAMLPVRDGKDIILIASSNTSKGIVIGAPGITKVSQCTKMGTTAPGTTTYGWAVSYAKPFGANYEVTSFTDYPSMTTALTSGTVNCAVVTYATAAPLLSKGITIIGDPTSSNFPADLSASMDGYVAGAIWGDKARVQQKSSAMKAFLRAFTKATHMMATGDPKQLTADLQQSDSYKSLDATLVANTIAYAQKEGTFIANDNRITEAGWAKTVAFLVSAAGVTFIDPTNSKWSYASRVDMSYFNN